MSPVGRVVQGLYLIVVGIAFSVRGAIALQDPDFWEPVTDLDYAAVWTHSLALMLVAPALVILVRRSRAGSAATIVALVSAGAAVVTAVANAIEDGFDLEGFGTLYVLAILPFLFGLIVLAILLFRGDHAAFGFVPLLTILGLFAYDAGGGIVIGATWVVFGILVLVGRTAPASMAEGSPVGPATPG
jgi:hypothetical protein